MSEESSIKVKITTIQGCNIFLNLYYKIYRYILVAINDKIYFNNKNRK